MHRLRQPFCFLLLCLLPLGAAAQLEIGVRGGLLRNQVPADYSDRVFFKSTWENRFSAGLVAFYPILDHLYAEAGLTYASKRSRIDREDAVTNTGYLSTQGVYFQTDRNYLELPLGLRLEAGNWNLLGGTWSVVLAGGGYAGYWLNGKTEARVNVITANPYLYDDPSEIFDNPQYLTVSGDYEFDDSYDRDGVRDNRWELGWYGGLALQYRREGFGRVWVEGRFQQGLTDLLQFEDEKPRSYQDRRNRNVRIEVGYALPLSSIF